MTFELKMKLNKLYAMRNNIKVLFLVVALSLVCNTRLYSQTVTCNTPTNICTNPSLSLAPASASVLSNTLTISNPVTNPQGGANQGCQLNNAINPQWFLINVTSSGNLGFTFGAPGSPNPQNGLLHWILWPYNATTCADIYNNTLPPVACNYNITNIGGTGMGTIPGLPANALNYQPSIPVLQGQQYLLLVSNVNGTNTVISYSNTGSAATSCNPLTIPSTSACINQAATITANWVGASNITFTVLPTTNSVVTGSSFTVSSAATQIYTVVGTASNAAGQAISATQFFTLTVNPCNVLTIPNTTICPNQIATITANWPGVSNISLTISPTTNSIQASLIFTVNPTVTQVYTVVGTGSTTSGPTITATQFFTVVVNPTPNLSVASATSCFGSTANLTVSPFPSTVTASGPGFPATTFTNGIIAIPNLVNIGVATYTAIGTFANGCISTTTAQVDVGPNFFIVTTTTINACQNTNVTLIGNLPSATNYTWFGAAFPAGGFETNAGNLGNVTLASVQKSVEGTYTVQAYINYNGITCLRTGTTLVRVVQTSSITVQPTFTLCQGEALNLTASATGTNITGYLWVGPSYSAALANTSVQNPLAGNYTVTVNFSDGNSVCPIIATSNAQIVTYNPVAVLVPTLICQYATANMFISATGNSPITSYLWTGPNNFVATAAGTTIANIQPLASGVYTGSVIFANGTKTCLAQGFAQISVVPVPSVIINPIPPVCRPGNVGLNASALAAINYSWAGPNSFTASTGNTTLYYPPVNATGVYTAYATFNNGGLTCYNTNTVFVSVNPVLTFTLPPYIQTCYNESLTVNGPAGATSYSWSSSSGYNSNDKDLTFTKIPTTMSGNYKLEISLGPCNSSQQLDIDVISPITFSLPPTPPESCVDLINGQLLQVGAEGGTGNYGYTWNPSNYLSSPTGSSVICKALGTTIFNVTAYDIACPNYTISLPFTVPIRPSPPHGKLSLEKVEGCEPLCLLYNSNTDRSSVITTYDFGGIRKYQGDSIPLCLPAGTYNLKIKYEAEGFCLDSVVFDAPIVVFPKSNSDIIWSPETPSTTDNLVTFSPVAKFGTVASYAWSFVGTGIEDGLDVDSTINPQRKYEEIGKYPVILISTTDKNCVDTTVKFLDIKDDLNVFIPNTFTPNGDNINDLFQVKGIGFKTESFLLDIYDRGGLLVFSTKDQAKGWDGYIKGQVAPQGSYIYKLRIIGQNGEGRKEYTGYVNLLK
jgi:gliding motility-associated-like protein